MRWKTYWGTASGVIVLICLILDSSCTAKAAYDGLILCIRTIIPSLFPFFVVSSYLSGRICQIKLPGMWILEKCCRIPKGSGLLVINGLLTGYPIGARSVYEEFHAGGLSEEDATRMLGFCSNAGPAFIFGIAGSMFEERAVPWMLWLNQIISAILTGWMIPGNSVGTCTKTRHTRSLPECVKKSVETAGVVCGWIIVFKILIDFLNRWCLFFLPGIIRITISGLLELSNGCISILEISSPSVRYLVCNSLLTAGGLCVWMQTKSAVGNLNTFWYIRGKIIQNIFSFLLGSITMKMLFQNEKPIFLESYIIISFLVVPFIFLIQKRSSNFKGTNV